MGNRFTLNVKLKQHSPLIHFQHDQHRAALRATELKPKLDRYIIEKEFEGKFELFKKYLVGYTKGFQKEQYNHRALDYKLTIRAPEADLSEHHDKLFFGNTGKDKSEKKEALNFQSDIELSIFSFHSKLLDIIKELLPEFLAITNFGTRQNKGFGSFYVSEDDPEHFKPIGDISLLKGTAYLEINSIRDNDIFDIISEYYKRLKSGINPNYGGKCRGGYQKSFLFQYIEKKNKDYTWEKRWLKETFFNLSPLNPPINPKFARAMLGMPVSFTFKKTNEPCNPGKKTYLRNNCQIEVTCKEIDRIPSPLLFKIIKESKTRKTKILILLDTKLIAEIQKEICSQKRRFYFTLSSRSQNRDRSYGNNNNNWLELPEQAIDYDDLLNYYHEELDYKVEKQSTYNYEKNRPNSAKITARIKSL